MDSSETENKSTMHVSYQGGGAWCRRNGKTGDGEEDLYIQLAEPKFVVGVFELPPNAKIAIDLIGSTEVTYFLPSREHNASVSWPEGEKVEQLIFTLYRMGDADEFILDSKVYTKEDVITETKNTPTLCAEDLFINAPKSRTPTLLSILMVITNQHIEQHKILPSEEELWVGLKVEYADDYDSMSGAFTELSQKSITRQDFRKKFKGWTQIAKK